MNYDARAGETLAAIKGGSFISGTSIACRTGGNKDGPGRAYGYLPAIGICPGQSRNRFESRAAMIANCYLTMANKQNKLQVYKQADVARAVAHSVLNGMANVRLAEYTPVQVGLMNSMDGKRADIRRTVEMIKYFERKKVDTTDLLAILEQDKKQIAEMSITLRQS